jgi:small ligand-binding sensory domain FIST
MTRIAAASSRAPGAARAAEEAAAEVEKLLGGAPVDLAFVFATTQHAERLEEAVETIARKLRPAHLAGATAESIVGGAVEFEGTPALSLWAASAPGADLHSALLTAENTPEGLAFLGSPEIPDGSGGMILLADPFSFPTEHYLERMGADYPELQILGGMSSGGRQPGECRLIHAGRVHSEGAVAVVVSGSLRVRPLVSQGCRPFGKPLVVTRIESNAILELGGAPAMEKLGEEMRSLSAIERTLLGRGLHVGLAIDARKRRHQRGDFLVRNVIGLIRDAGGILVPEIVRPGTTVQFHLRDAETASEDLHALLQEARTSGSRPAGALLFSCNGRGSRMFDIPNHDAASLAREMGPLPAAGFFAAGEIGPVGGRNFLHGFTASIALFEEA